MFVGGAYTKATPLMEQWAKKFNLSLERMRSLTQASGEEGKNIAQVIQVTGEHEGSPSRTALL